MEISHKLPVDWVIFIFMASGLCSAVSNECPLNEWSPIYNETSL